ncbi:MAG: OsmC family protein [Bacteroidales bacterium]|nr:OsmC family protein [Bacteroidales bacterium]MCF8343240.1 OsmC family protein [Bacteroidales bacterium]MCF8351235.1 OsmC family protein [Bacteroidales bacterium]MCF8374851.1 OsmC family protein [Bacteroidales bacterium]MCF8399745.1 OsmC family protein [Bacteroidales bacterium]
MDITAHIEYQGNLRTKATHIRSGSELITDAPVDNRGKGEAFSPTDMVAAALGSCILTTVGIKAMDAGFSIDGADANVRKIMASDPRRISEIIVEMNFPSRDYSEKIKTIIKNTAKTCPVAKSLHPGLKQTMIFNFL